MASLSLLRAAVERVLARSRCVLPAAALAAVGGLAHADTASAQAPRRAEGPDARPDRPARTDPAARRGPMGGRQGARLRRAPRTDPRGGPPSAASRGGGPFVLLPPGQSPFDPPVDAGYSAAPALADLDADGDLDLVVGEYYGTFRYFENQGGDVFTERTDADNPLGGLAVPQQSTPTFVDLDADGDLDLVSGEYDGYFHLYENEAGVFTEQTGADNPFDGLFSDYYSTPAFADLDDDGDPDLVSGNEGGYFHYFRNEAGVFTEQTGAANPLDGLYTDYNSTPAFADLDGDGDPDLVAGDSDYGALSYFRNDEGTFVYVPDTPFDEFDHNLRSYSTPAFADLDDDGDPDLVAGEYYGHVFLMENLGTPTEPVIDPPVLLGGDGVGFTSRPVFADLDGDGDPDLVAGDYNGRLHYFEQTGRRYVRRTGAASPFDGADVGFSSAPTFVDLDTDGDLDLVSGEYYGGFRFFENEAGVFTEQTGSDNPFDGIDQGTTPAPTFVDLDTDGDPDLVAGGLVGLFHYYRNDGGAFVEQTGADNPLDGISSGTSSTPTFVDLDGDGDPDLVAGEYSGLFHYYRNDDGAFTEQTGADNPLDGLLADYSSAPTFVDLDADGDLDLVSGDYYGAFAVFANGDFVPIAVEPAPGVPAYTHVLAPPAPNPSRGPAHVALLVADAQVVDVALYDLLGRRVRTLHSGPLAAGRAHTLTVGGDLPSGVYVVRVVGETFTDSIRLTRVR